MTRAGDLTQPVSARVPGPIYRQTFALCDARDCSVSELLCGLLAEAIEDGRAARMVEAIEQRNRTSRQQLGRSAIKSRLTRARQQVMLLEVALEGANAP